MTTLAAWSGVDSRRPSSLYLVADSRVSAHRSDTGEIVGKLTDCGQKLFASEKEPHVFGYSGGADFAPLALEMLIDSIDSGACFAAVRRFAERQARVQRFLKEQLLRRPASDRMVPFSIAHGAREGSRMSSRFHLWISDWSPAKGWQTKKRYPRRESVLLYSTGTGGTRLRTRDRAWRKSEIGKKSRGVYGAFADALSSRGDLQSGGGPQLVGIFDVGPARYFGVVFEKKRYLKGCRVDGRIPAGYDWFNDTFEGVDPVTLEVLPHRQRQPRPKKLSRPRRRKPILDRLS